MKRIAIIGAGASGTLLALNLLRLDTDQSIRISVIERDERRCKGVAFGTDDDIHLLNVPAAKMGALPDDVGHFHNWLVDRGHSFTGSDFVPRRLFGQYLRSLLDDAIDQRPANVEIKLIDDDAVGYTRNENQARIALSSGNAIDVDSCVLAFGNFLPPDPAVPDSGFIDNKKYFRNVWEPGIYDRLDPDYRILIIGTGLSMVDVALKLNSIGHRGEINAVSTRGLLPAVHKLGFEYPDFQNELIGSTRITDIFTKVRKHIDRANANGSDWRAVIDSLRPVTQRLWQDLPIEEKRYFLQHLSRYWNVARHRMPPNAAAVIDDLRGSGQLRILKGRLKNIRVTQEKCFLLRYLDMGTELSINADVIFNCIASEANFAKLESPLVRDLLGRGLIRVSEIGIGLDSTPDGRLIASDGETGNKLFTLGTALKGTLWETTAIPEIRSQARDLAIRLLNGR